MVLIFGKRRIITIAIIFIMIIGIASIDIGRSVATFLSVSGDAKKVILLDPGHGGEDPGAVSDYSGIIEKDINLYIANHLKMLLEKENYNVIMTRTEDTLVYDEETRGMTQKRKQDLLRRKKMMDEGGADIVVSIHLNKFPQTEYWGFQTFYPQKSKESENLAKAIQSELANSVDKTNKREALLKKETIIVFKDVKTPSVIVECGFLSNVEEEKKLADKNYQEKLANGIKEGIKKYLNKKS